MKTIQSLSLLAAGAILLFSSCGESTPEAPKGPMKYDILQKLPKGYTHHMVQTHTETFSMGEGEKATPPMTSEMTMKLTEVVSNVGADGTLTFETSYDHFSGKMVSPDGKMVEFNTSTPSDDPSVQMFYSMVGNKISYDCAANGTVSHVTNGMDDKMKGIFMDSTYSMSKNLEELLNTFDFTPDSAVAVGDSWKTSNGTSAMYPMWFENTMTLVKADSATLTIDITSQVTPHPKGIADAMMGSMTDWKLTGTRKGTVTADAKTGAIRTSNLVIDVTGTMITIADGKEHKTDITTPVRIMITDKMEFTQ